MMDNKIIRIEVALQKRSTLTAEVLQNIAPYGEDLTGGGIAVFNLAEHEVSCTFSPAEIDGITECERYLVYDRFSGTYQFVGRKKITVNGKDMADSAICKGGLINLPMEEKSGQTVVTIS